MKVTQISKINEVVYWWFYSLRNRGLPTISRPIIKEKAKFFLQKFLDEKKGFRTCEGWLHRWKSFYSTHQLNVNNEKLFVDEVEVMLYCGHNF